MHIMICSDLHWDKDFDPKIELDVLTGRAYPLNQNAVFQQLISSAEFNTLTADDLICIAGDVAEGAAGIRHCLTELRAHTAATIVAVMGNHDYAKTALAQITVDQIQADLPERVHLLDNQAVELAGVRVLGCTLWTNPDPEFHEVGQNLMPEYAQVDNQDGQPLSVTDTLAAHHQSVAWLNAELAKPFTGKTVVMTHHAPSFISQHDKYRFDELSEFFCVNLEDLINQHQPELWIHGHLHEPVDYELEATRIISAPLGYPDERKGNYRPAVLMI